MTDGKHTHTHDGDSLSRVRQITQTGDTPVSKTLMTETKLFLKYQETEILKNGVKCEIEYNLNCNLKL